MRQQYPAETTNVYRPPKVAVWLKLSKCKNETKSFLVFLTSLLKTKIEFFFVRKFENEKGKDGIYTIPGRTGVALRFSRR